MKQVTLRVVLFTLTIVVISGLADSVSAQEKTISAKSVPSAVISAFKSRYPNATIKSFAREKENGKVFYEIESKDGDIGRDVLYNPDGSVVAVEETIAASDLPASIQEFVRSKYAGAVITKAEKSTQGDAVEYEVFVKHRKKRLALEFDADGNLKNKK